MSAATNGTLIPNRLNITISPGAKRWVGLSCRQNPSNTLPVLACDTQTSAGRAENLSPDSGTLRITSALHQFANFPKNLSQLRNFCPLSGFNTKAGPPLMD